QPNPADELADALAQNTASWLRRVMNTSDVRAFTQFAMRLEPTLRTLAARGDAKTLFAVSSTLHTIAMEGTQVSGTRAQVAAKLVRLFGDPAFLASMAEHLLVSSADEDREYPRRLLVHAGVAGAYALYGARIKLSNDPAIRARFTTALKDFGV